MCSFNVLSMNVCVSVCVCDCFMSSRNWTAHQVLACIASDVVSALYVCIVVFVVVHTLLSGTKKLDAKKKGKGKGKNKDTWV